jgi:hypothetical protein
LIVGLLRRKRLLERVQVMNRKTWVELLRASGFTDIDLHRWHRDFERLDPARHQRFLEFLGMADREVARIRAWSRAEVAATAAGSRPPRGRPSARAGRSDRRRRMREISGEVPRPAKVRSSS